MKQLFMLLLVALFATSCATTFSGDAHTTPKQCVKQCSDVFAKLSVVQIR
jgi:PBP1b-binding outer membrane lipoprotein LpoB